MANPSGLCKCGCGATTALASRNVHSRSIVMGTPLDYLHGHNNRGKARPLLDGIDTSDEKACWEWTRGDNSVGYGKVWSPTEGRVVMAHREVYRELVGEIPVGYELDHRCRNRACVNPLHLEPVTHSENVRRGWEHRER